MSLLVAPLTLWAGPAVPVPPPPAVLEALDSIEVSTSDTGRSGFQLTFRAGRGPSDPIDYPVLATPQFAPFARVLIIVTFGVVPQVLMDGIVTHRQLSPGAEPGTTSVSVTGEDVSVMMDLEERSAEHPGQAEPVIAAKIIATYARFGLVPVIVPPPALDIPIPIERIPTQQETDLAYLTRMASRFGFDFHVTPGPAPGVNTAYWGPPQRVAPQRALSVGVGPQSNVDRIDFAEDGLSAALEQGVVQDRRSNAQIPVQTFTSTRVPLARNRPMPPHIRTRVFRDGGLDAAQAFARAQGRTDAAMDGVVTATGELDSLRYEGLLRPRALVGLRGLGDSYGGLYYVRSVNHRIRRGSYRQAFALAREGTGATVPAVLP